MKESNTKPQASENGGSEAIDWEQRPGGMLVQKREDGVDPTIPLIKIKVFHDSYKHDVTVPAQSTFGELKRVLVQETGLAPEEQRLLFRGKEKNDDECLHMAGVKDTSKVVLLQDPASRERKLEQTQLDQELVKAFEAVGVVRVEVDKLVEKVNNLESSLNMGTKVADQEFVVLTELLMRLLLKLDAIEADGEAKVQRRTETHPSLKHHKDKVIVNWRDLGTLCGTDRANGGNTSMGVELSYNFGVEEIPEEDVVAEQSGRMKNKSKTTSAIDMIADAVTHIAKNMDNPVEIAPVGAPSRLRIEAMYQALSVMTDLSEDDLIKAIDLLSVDAIKCEVFLILPGIVRRRWLHIHIFE